MTLLPIIIGACSTTPRTALDDIISKNTTWVNENRGTCGFFASVDDVKIWGTYWGTLKYPYESEELGEKLRWCTVCWNPRKNGLQGAKSQCSTDVFGGKEAFLLFERPYGNPAGFTHIQSAAAISKNNTDRMVQERNRQQQVQQQQEQQRQTDDRARKCVSFGFQPNTTQYNDCMFELYKLEESARQNQALIQSLSDSSARQNAILQQQLEEQRFESGMRMLQNAADMINPPSTKTTCKYNSALKKMTCY
jgi:hypothetical protein